MSDNNTTELLRKLLDERGIEYAESQDRFRTRFRFNYCEACGDYLNEIEVMGACITASKSYLTPDQAISATLGSGTCHISFIDEYECASGDESYLCECSECGSQAWELAHDLPLYCRKCGRKVK